MKIFLLSAFTSHECLDRLVDLAALDICGRHERVLDVADADAIVFTENTQFDDLTFKSVMNHPVVRRYPDKVFMYNEVDKAWPVLPGLYCSLSKKLAMESDNVAFPYLTSTNANIKHIHESNAERQWLYSFVGSASHPIRKQLLKLDQQDAKIVDTSEFCAWDPLQSSAHSYQQLYCETIAQSKFILCPRGIGPSSLRLYETIEAGRIPVIVSDDWVPPPQIAWDFAVRVPESKISDIPGILARLEPEWQERSVAARQAWEAAYSPEQLFNSLGDALERIAATATRKTELPISARFHKYGVLLENALTRRIKGQKGVGVVKKPEIKRPSTKAPVARVQRLRG